MTVIKPTPAGRVFRTCVLLGAASLLATACYTTTIRSGKPPAPATIQYDEKWHHGLVYGMAELSGPYNLQEMCPNGWAEITTETSFINGITQSFTSNIYSPQSVTVRCASVTTSAAIPQETTSRPADTPKAEAVDAEPVDAEAVDAEPVEAEGTD